MKNNNEILTILEDRLVRLINLCNGWYDRTHDMARIEELIVLCEKIRIPLDFEWDEEIIKAITISGKRIEFETVTYCRDIKEVRNEKSIY